MRRGLDIENSDAFFSMRGKFWQESRDRALAEKERKKPFGQQSEDSDESCENNEDKIVEILPS